MMRLTHWARMIHNTSWATMNMLFNAERPRFDSRLRSARQRPQRAAGARNTAARERRWVPSFRLRRLPWRVCGAAGRERLGSRFLKAPIGSGNYLIIGTSAILINSKAEPCHVNELPIPLVCQKRVKRALRAHQALKGPFQSLHTDTLG